MGEGDVFGVVGVVPVEVGGDPPGVGLEDTVAEEPDLEAADGIEVILGPFLIKIAGHHAFVQHREDL